MRARGMGGGEILMRERWELFACCPTGVLRKESDGLCGARVHGNVIALVLYRASAASFAELREELCQGHAELAV